MTYTIKRIRLLRPHERARQRGQGHTTTSTGACARVDRLDDLVLERAPAGERLRDAGARDPA